MKKRVWTVMPIYLIFVLVMLIMSFASFGYNKILFLVEIGISLIAFAVVLLMTLKFKRYIKNVVTDAVSSINDVSADYLESLKMATAVIGEHGEILMYNREFKQIFFKGSDALSDNISAYLKDDTVEYLCEMPSGVNIDFDSKKLTVYCNKVDKGYILSVIDNTYFRNLEKEYFDTRKSVALVVLDNIDDFLSYSEEEGTQAMLTVENLLSRWSGKHNCLYRKLSDSKYLIIFDEQVLCTQIDKKFRILDKVRQISVGDNNATISIGIGRNCDSLTQSHTNAKKALDMALGRGGDQVAVLTDGEYEFFGGVSKGVSKTSKVRVRVVAQSVKNAILGADKVLIMGHKFPDLDCIGAATGIYSAVTKTFSKRAYIVTDVDKSMAKSLIDSLSAVNKDMFISADRAHSLVTDKTLLVIVDTHSPDFIESPKLHSICRKVVVVDHHRKMVNFIDNADVFFHEPSASSTSEMVTELVTYLGGDTLSKIEAEALLSGIMLDTKNFVINTGVRTFEAAAFLRKKGADTVNVRNMFSSSIDTYMDKYKVVSKAEVIGNCAVSTIDEIVKNSRLLSAQAADEMLTIRDVYASFVISYIDSKTVNISARSYGKINVQLVMEKLGGGGHQNMAAVQLPDHSIKQAKEKLIEIIKSL